MGVASCLAKRCRARTFAKLRLKYHGYFVIVGAGATIKTLPLILGWGEHTTRARHRWKATVALFPRKLSRALMLCQTNGACLVGIDSRVVWRIPYHHLVVLVVSLAKGIIFGGAFEFVARDLSGY